MQQKKEYPSQFQAEILLRAIGEKGLKDLYDQYRLARKREAFFRPPSAAEIRMASLVREFGYTGAASKIGQPVAKIYSAFNRTAKYQFLQGKK